MRRVHLLRFGVWSTTRIGEEEVLNNRGCAPYPLIC